MVDDPLGKIRGAFAMVTQDTQEFTETKLGSVLLKSQIRQCSPKVERNISRIFT